MPASSKVMGGPQDGRWYWTRLRYPGWQRRERREWLCGDGARGAGSLRGAAAGSANESNLLREVENVRAVDQNGPLFLNFMCIKLSARDLAKSVKLLIKPLTVLRDFVGGREHRINSAVRDKDFYSVAVSQTSHRNRTKSVSEQE